MEHSMIEEVSPNSGSESPDMLAANNCSNVISNSYSAAKDEGSSSKYSQHKNIITPKVRVVHIYEPKIIKTDPENFRPLVQRLTGKSSHKSKEKRRQTNHKSTSSEVIAAEVGSENLEYTFYSNYQQPIMENETEKLSSEDCSGFSKGFSDADRIFWSPMNQGLLDEIPLNVPGMVDQGLSSEVVAAEPGTGNLEYTFYCNDQQPIQEDSTTNLTEDCTGFSKEFCDTDMIFPSLMNQGTDDEIPLVWNNSPFCHMSDHTGV
jgi:hypothetical protein